MKKRLVSILLVLCMVLSLLPGTAWAEEIVPEENEAPIESSTIEESEAPVGNDAPEENGDGVTSGTCGDNLTWSYNNGTLTISGTGGMGDYRHGGIPWWDYRNQIHTVKIGDGIINIGAAAFSHCTSLTDVLIPSSVAKIETWAFLECTSLTSMTIPSSVTNIGSYAFDGCTSLTQIKVSTNNPAYSDIDGVLFEKNGKTLITCPGGRQGHYSIPSSVTSIGDSAFEGCTGLTGVDIPSGVTSIGKYAFSGCGDLTSVTIPNSVTSIGALAFSICTSLTQIKVSTNNPAYSDIDGVLFEKNEKSLITCPGGRQGHYSIPSSVTSIGDSAFYKCTGLNSVVIPSGVTSIGNYAFNYCTRLTDIYYGGTEAQWKAISIGDHNDPLASATIHFNGAGPTPDTATITNLYPANSATGVGDGANSPKKFQITFDREIANDGAIAQVDLSRPGAFSVYRASDDQTIYQSTQYSTHNFLIVYQQEYILSVASTELDADTEYYITLDAGIVQFKDGTTNPAIAKGEWQFTTEETTLEPPTQMYTVSYNLDGGSGGPTSASYAAGVEVTIPAMVPIKDGCTFAGWKWSGAPVIYQPGQVFTMLDQDVTFVASWEQQPQSPIIAQEFVAEALKYVGCSEAEFEKKTGRQVANGQWCSDFIGVCADLVNAKEVIPREAAGWKLSAKIIEKGGTLVNTPQKGDIATFRQSSGFGHVGIVCDVDDTYVYIVHGNWHEHVCAPKGYSSNGSDCIKNYSNCGKWPLATLVNQGATIESFTRPNWAVAGSSATAKYGHVITFECPIDVSFSYADERLDSAAGQYDAAFGNMVVEESDEKKIIVTLYDNYSTDVNIVGTGEGRMTVTSTYLKDDSIIDTRIFENVPIYNDTTGKLYAYDSTGTDLLEINSGEIFVETWAADKNETVSAASKEATNWYFSEQDTKNNSEDKNTSTPSNSHSTSDSKPNYSINIPNSITGGTVTVSPTSAITGSKVTITAIPNSGYELNALTVTDANGKELTLTNEGKGKYTFTMPNSKVSINAGFHTVETQPGSYFADVSTDDWYYDAVKYVTENGLMSGVGDGKFAPDANMSRAMLTQILYNREGNPNVNGNSVFSDISADVWYTDSVLWASEKGIVDGYGNGLFGPNDDITREQFAAILYRYAGSPTPTDSLLNFSDAHEVSSWAHDAVSWVVEQGILRADANGLLNPTGSVTRAEAALMIQYYSTS